MVSVHTSPKKGKKNQFQIEMLSSPATPPPPQKKKKIGG